MTSHILALLVAILSLIYPFYADSTSISDVHQKCEYQIVSRVIDGDTFELSDGRRVRLLGVDTPETVDHREDVEWFGREAAKKLKEWISGKMVCLKKDRDKTQDIDAHGRLLRYVWITKGDSFVHPVRYEISNGVNAELIKQGYGFAYTNYPFQYLEKFRKYETDAKRNNRGLWNRKKQKLWEREVERNKSLSRTCGRDNTICPEDTIRHIGEYRTVRFFVRKSYNSGKAVFLNSKNDFRDPDNFTAVIFEENKNKFPKEPADYYWGKTIDVRGKIVEHEGRAEIILERPYQIKILQ